MQAYSTSQTTDKTAATQHASQDQQASPSFEFSDQRPEMVAQRKIQQLADTFSSQQAIQLKQSGPPSGEPVIQRMLLINRRQGANPKPKMIASSNFTRNHTIAKTTAITDGEAEAKRAARGATQSQNTLLQKTALIREAIAKRDLLTANVGGVSVTLNFNAGEARVATRSSTGTLAVRDVSSAIVNTRTAATSQVEIYHLENIPGA